MDFNDTKEEAAFRAEVRTWIDANAPKHLKADLETSGFGATSTGDFDVNVESKKWQKKKAEAGWACLAWPKEYGGRDATAIQSVIWGQEEGVYAKLSGQFIIGQGMCAPTLMTYVTEEQKQQYIPKIASGEDMWCQLFSEPSGGSDLAGLRTKAEQDGDDWIINGQKIWTSLAHMSQYGILITRTDPSVAKHKGLTMFFLDISSPGVEIRPIKQANGQSGFNEVFFDNVRIPDSQRLGEVGDGWRVSLTTLMNERMAIGGGISTGYEELKSLLMKTEFNGKPAIKDPAIRSKLADWHCKAMGLKNTSTRTISALSQGQEPGPESSIGKLVAGSMRQDVAKFALDIQGLGGSITNSDIARDGAQFQEMLLRSPAIRVEGGTDQILRNIIGERVLGLPADMRADKGLAFKDIPSGN